MEALIPGRAGLIRRADAIPGKAEGLFPGTDDLFSYRADIFPKGDTLFPKGDPVFRKRDDLFTGTNVSPGKAFIHSYSLAVRNSALG